MLQWTFVHLSAGILECFTAISYLFREAFRAFNAPIRIRG
jgi:hypothetical protein